MRDVLAQLRYNDFANEKIIERPATAEKGKKQKRIKEYDFKIPRKFTKEQLRTVVGVYDIYARHVSSYLTGTLRTFCRVEVSSVEETKYIEYVSLMPETALLGVFELNPFEGNVLMEMSQDLTFVIIDKLLGGTGNCEIKDREYTDIEMVVMERLYKNVISYFKDAWKSVAEVDPVFIKIETSNGASQVMHLDEIVVVVVLNVKINETAGRLTVILPYEWLESINDKLYTKYRLAEKTKSDINYEATRKHIMDRIYRSQIYVDANLVTTQMLMKDLIRIEVGDIIKLNQKPSDVVRVNVGSKTLFYAKLGVRNDKKAVKIVKNVNEEQ